MFTKRILALALLSSLFFGAKTRADLMISFTEDGSAFHAVVAAGATVELSVYILQTGSTTDDGVNLTTEGLGVAGVQLNYDIGGNHATATAVDLVSDWSSLAQADFDNSLGIAAMYGSNLSGSNIKGNPIAIGTVTFKAGNQAGVVTEITSSDLVDDSVVPYQESIVIGGEFGLPPVVLDPEVFSSTTIGKIETVPEPSTLVLSLVGLGLFGAVRVVRRRRSRS